MDGSLKEPFKFIIEIDKLKAIQRKTLNYNDKRYENSAEHSWHLALAVLVFADHANFENLNILKMLKMALIHDIVEVDAGDQIIYANDPDKTSREAQAAERIFGLLAGDQSNEFKSLWEEFESKRSKEARFVASLDRFLPLLSNCLNQGHSWKQHSITHNAILNKNKDIISDGSLPLWQACERLLQKAIEEGHLSN